MAMVIKKGLVTISGNFQGAYRKFIETMYRAVDYVKPKSLDGTYMEPVITVKPEAMAKLQNTDSAEELLKKFTNGYEIESVHIHGQFITLHSDIATTRDITKKVEDFNRTYKTELQVKTEEINPDSIKNDVDWDSFSRVGS